MGDKKNKAILVGAIVLLLAIVGCLLALTLNIDSQDSTPPPSKQPSVMTSVKSIRSICEPAAYRKACEKELTTATAGNKTDTKSLIEAVLHIPIKHLQDAWNRSTVLAQAAKDPANRAALKGCNIAFDSAIYALEKTVGTVQAHGMHELHKILYDVQSWLSEANTFQEDCLDGFKGVSNPGADKMKKALNVSMKLTSNALAICGKASEMIQEYDIPELVGDADLSRRRLLGDSRREHPSWVTEEQKRFLGQKKSSSPFKRKPLVIVAKDGSGHFKTINEGLAAMPRKNEDFVVMYVKAGVYKEKLIVERHLNKLIMIGDGPTKTRVTGDLNVKMGKNITTFQSATFSVVGEEFMAKDIGFENSAGPEGHQAVAFRSQSDKSVLYKCRFDGYQDTLYAHTDRQYYRECTISGTVDFIFGNAAVVFQKCKILVRKPMEHQQNIVTAHGSKDTNEVTAFVFMNSKIVAEPSLVPLAEKNPTYLGRPWKAFARTIFIQTGIDGFVHPDGWMPWQNEPDSIRTCFYAEIDSRGLGANKSKRVTWPGVKNLTLQDAKDKYTTKNFFHEDVWPKSTGVPVSGLLKSD